MSYDGENYSVSYVERPPLFWWLLTSLFSIGLSPYSALVISPLFTALNAVLVALFAYELSRDFKSGIFAGILVGLSGFAISVGSHILSDAMGSFLAALAMFSFYEYVFKNRRWFALISGASIGLGLVARDEDLVTIVLMIVLLIIFVPKGGVEKNPVFHGFRHDLRNTCTSLRRNWNDTAYLKIRNSHSLRLLAGHSSYRSLSHFSRV